MNRFTSFIILTSAWVLVACTSTLPKPEQYGFRRVSIRGQEYLCAPPKAVIPPVVAEWTSPDAYLSADVFRTSEISTAYPSVREVCLTQAQWPEWLMLRNRYNRIWPVTPATVTPAAAH